MTRLKLYNPVKRPIITQRYGKDGTDPSMLATYNGIGISYHNGIDLIAFDGTPVYASHDGRVTFAGYDGSGGLGVVIRTNEPFELQDGSISYVKSIYWHLKRDSLKVTGGQTVKAGQQIAEADNTGLSTGSHLHFGIKPIAKGENDWTWYNTEQNNGMGGAINPEPYLIPFQQEMKYGETWNDLIKLQKFLKELGFYHTEPYARYGPLTAQAVLAFQKKYCKLSWYEEYVMRGKVCGPKTLEQLNIQWYNKKS
jgi:hypothetical protein